MTALTSRLGTILGAFALRPTIAVALVIGLSVPVGLAVWRGLEERRETLLDHLIDEHERIAEVLAIGMQTPIWEVRPDTGQPLIDALMRNDQVVAITVASPLLDQFLEASAPDRRGGEPLVRERDVVRAGKSIGTVTVEMSTASLEADISRQWKQVLVTGALQLVFGMLLLFPLLRHKVLEPVDRLVEQSAALAAGVLDRPFVWRRGDELGELGRSFEDTRRALAALVHDLEHRNAELKAREADINERRALLRAILDNMTDGVTLFDADLRLVRWNDRFLETMRLSEANIRPGLRVEEMVEHDLERGRLVTDDRNAILEAVRDSFRVGGPMQSEYTMTDGQHILIRRRPMPGGGFVSTYSDITERIEARNKVEDALKLLESVMNAVPAVIHVKDRDLRYKMVNKQFPHWWGVESKDVIGRTNAEVFDASMFAESGPFAETENRDRRVLETGRRLPFYEGHCPREVGDKIVTWTTKVPLFDADNNVAHILTVDFDITDRRNMELERQRWLNLFQDAVESLRLGFAVYDSSRHLVICNSAYSALFDTTPSGMGGIDVNEVVPRFLSKVRTYDGCAGDAAEAALRRTIEDAWAGNMSPLEVELRDGRWLLVSGHATGEGGMVWLRTDITDLKRMENALRESEQRFRGIVEAAADAIVTAGEDGRIIEFNPAAERTFGIPRADAVGKLISEAIVPPRWRERHDAALTRLGAGGEMRGGGQVVEVEGLRANGEVFPIELIVTEVPHEGRRRFTAFIRDITERKRMESERQRWVQLVQDAIDSIEGGFAIYDSSKCLVVCNAAYSAPYGQAPEDMVGVCMDDLVPSFLERIKTFDGIPSERAEATVKRTLDPALARGARPVEMELRNGQWMLITRHPTSEDGMVWMRTDVTELKHMQKELEDSEERFRIIAETHPVPSVIFSSDHQMIYASPGFSNLVGGAPRGMTTKDLCVGSPDCDDLIAEVDASGFADRFEMSIRRLDGAPIDVSISARPITYGGEQAVLASVFDLTEWKQAEAELRRHREALHQSEKLGALGALLAGVAHELNNPLSVVVGRSIMLEDLFGESKHAESVRKLRGAAERCARIVKTFLALARQQQPVRPRVALSDVVEAALDLTEYGLRTSGIEVVLDLPDSLPELYADPDQLTQVFVNLFVNAQQACTDQPGPHRLEVSARFDAAAGAVCVAVADNGPGIPSEILPRIFDPFFTTKPVGEGTGLGLSVSDGIIKSHGGTIAAARPDAGGTRFDIVLPVDEHASDDDSFLGPAAGADGTRRILVVDDEPEVAETLGEILKAEGHSVAYAESGRVALQHLTDDDFDLVISDLRMPDLDGPGLYKALREQNAPLAERMVFVTGDTLSPAARRFLDGANRPVIEKPFVPEDVRRALARASGQTGE